MREELLLIYFIRGNFWFEMLHRFSVFATYRMIRSTWRRFVVIGKHDSFEKVSTAQRGNFPLTCRPPGHTGNRRNHLILKPSDKTTVTLHPDVKKINLGPKIKSTPSCDIIFLNIFFWLHWKSCEKNTHGWAQLILIFPCAFYRI